MRTTLTARGESQTPARASNFSPNQGRETADDAGIGEVFERRFGGKGPLAARLDFHHGLLLSLASLAFALLCTVSALAVAPPSAAPAGDFLTADVLTVDAPAPATCDAQLVSSKTVASSPVPMGFEEALFGSCNSNQCYLACIQKGYWAGYCISGTCVCQSNPSF